MIAPPTHAREKYFARLFYRRQSQGSEGPRSIRSNSCVVSQTQGNRFVEFGGGRVGQVCAVPPQTVAGGAAPPRRIDPPYGEQGECPGGRLKFQMRFRLIFVRIVPIKTDLSGQSAPRAVFNNSSAVPIVKRENRNCRKIGVHCFIGLGVFVAILESVSATDWPMRGRGNKSAPYLRTAFSI
jgi:hypothetical protein